MNEQTPNGEITTHTGRLLCVPLDALATPRDGSVMTDRWWVVRDGGAVFWQPKGARRGWTPQCNQDRRLPDRMVQRMYPGATVEFVPLAYLGYWNDETGYNLTPDLIEAAARTDSRPEEAP